MKHIKNNLVPVSIFVLAYPFGWPESAAGIWQQRYIHGLQEIPFLPWP